MKKAKWIGLSAVAGVIATLALSVSAQTSAIAPDAWAWRATVYLWLPSVKSSTELDLPGGGTISGSTDTSSRDVLSKLKFAFAGTLESRRGPWSFLGDVQYYNFGSLKSKVTSISGPTGIVTVPIDAGSRANLKTFIGTFEGGYAVLQTPGARADILGGVRYANVKPELSWELSGPTGGLATEGSVEKTKDFLDGVVGVRGSANLGGNWDLRYYLDAGAGSSRLTWQAVAGIGYNFKWGDAELAYRHLTYEFHNDRPISDLKMSGPQITVGFKF
jgi:opacity protein-like surface antigen